MTAPDQVEISGKIKLKGYYRAKQAARILKQNNFGVWGAAQNFSFMDPFPNLIDIQAKKEIFMPIYI